MCDSTVDFSVLCSMLEAVSRSKKPAVKRKHLRTFLDHVYTDHEFFSALRLLLPALDKERGTYGLKETALARCIADALGLAKESEDAKKLLNWRKGQAGNNTGNFPLVAAEVLFRRQSTSSGGLKIRDVNNYLDQLASAESREEKSAVLGEMITKTNVQEIKWIIVVILKEPKLGLSEKTIFREFHPDAEDLFNVTCDLKLVCEKLKDRSQRYQRQDIEVGKPVRPQLAARVADVEEAWRKLRGKKIVVECKFDGDRIQIHKNGTAVHFFSRSFIDHQEYKEAIADVILQQIKIDRCILDGEMLVWNRVTNRFADFGSNQEAAKAAKEGLESDQQLCYVAFDILYAGDGSVIHLSLHERQLLLKQVVQPLKGSLELLLPENGFGCEDERRWSKLVPTAEELEHFFLETVENRDEGVVIKDLDSKWEPGDRSTKWIKLKPDYIHVESELDVLIIGGYLGTGRQGGQVGQFLLGLAERPKLGGHPTRFISFCKVGTGLSDDERDILLNKLSPYLRKNDKNMRPPSFYTVTNTAKERPDFWVDHPEKSIIVEIISDIRTIKSEVFASPYSLRFPRIRRVRYDKPWYDCLDVQSLVDLVHSKSGNTADVRANGETSRPKIPKQKKAVQLVPLVPSHMMVTDVSHVKKETSIFKGLVFYFINAHPQDSKGNLHKLVTEHGGSFSMNMNESITHAIAAEKKGIRYQAAAAHRDIVHQSWVTDCCSQKALLPLRPKYILHLSAASKLKLQNDADEFGDSYMHEVDIADLKQLFQNLEAIDYPVSKEEICHFQKKYCQRERFGQFCDCRIYFHHPIHSNNRDSQMAAEVSLKRLELEVLMLDGEVTSNLKNATHMIIYKSLDHPVSFNNIVRSVTKEEREALKRQDLHVVDYAWLETSLASNIRLSEQNYNLRESVESDKEGPLSPDKSFSKEQLPQGGGKLRKRAKSSMRSTDSASETEEITSRRRLYRPKGAKTGSTMKSNTSGNKSQVSKQTKAKNAGEKHKRRVSSTKIQTQENPIAGEQTSISTSKAHPQNTDGNEGSRESLQTMSSFQGTPERTNQETQQAGTIHLPENQRVSANVAADASLRTHGNTAGKKKKVSYKDLVGDLLGRQ